MERAHRTRTWTVLVAVSLFLCTVEPGSVEAGSRGKSGAALDCGGGKTVRLSLKISDAKKRKRQVSFYKSVARQAKIRTSVNRSPPSVR